jgi:putative flippase GtrA
MPERFRGLTKELAKFGTIGVINVIMNFAVSNALLLTVFRGGEVKAKAVATLVATTSAYFMNRHWTYRDRPKSTLRREYTLFFFFNLIGLLIESGAVAFTKYGLHMTHIVAFNISTAVGIGLGTLFRFWAYRTHVFKLDETEPAPSVPMAMAAALADAPDIPPEEPAGDAALAAAETHPHIVVTSSPGGSVIIKIVNAAEEVDQIDLDDADQPVRARG